MNSTKCYSNWDCYQGCTCINGNCIPRFPILIDHPHLLGLNEEVIKDIQDYYDEQEREI